MEATSSNLQVLVVEGLAVDELGGHWDLLVRRNSSRGVLTPRPLQDPSGCGAPHKRQW